jgi:N-acetylglucosaminyldiphosphoundecaprenol N-acetyl-beta-D-mannosaminyltransferase
MRVNSSDAGGDDVIRLDAAGTALDVVGRTELMQLVEQRLNGGGRPLVIASSNLDHLHHFGSRSRYVDPAAQAATADWVVTADGMPLVWWARRRLGRPVEQLAGSDLLPSLLTVAETIGAQVGFIGGWPEQHQRLASVLQSRFPRLNVSGYWGPTREELGQPLATSAMVDQLKGAGVDLLVVGLGKPRQELWLSRNIIGTGARVAVAFGAAADFMAGSAIRAPGPLRRRGFEWLYRLVREPRRLWRRYLVEGPQALWLLTRSPSR